MARVRSRWSGAVVRVLYEKRGKAEERNMVQGHEEVLPSGLCQHSDGLVPKGHCSKGSLCRERRVLGHVGFQ